MKWGREFNTEKNTKQCIRQFQLNYQKRTLNNSNLNSLCNVIKTTKTSPSHKPYRVINIHELYLFKPSMLTMIELFYKPQNGF